MATKKITELTNVTSVQDTDLLIVETSEGTRSINKKNIIPVVPTALSGLTDDSTHRLVTDAEKATWNAKATVSAGTTDLTAGTSALNSGEIYLVYE